MGLTLGSIGGSNLGSAGDSTKESSFASKAFNVLGVNDIIVRKSIPPPVVTDVDDAGEDPGVAPISDNDSVDSLLFSSASESEGDILGNSNYDDDV